MKHGGANACPRTRRGLTLVEVLVAASILAIAALSLTELLASSDRIGLSSRRQALAAMEAERALELLCEATKSNGPLPSSAVLQAGMEGEALEGCDLTVTAVDRVEEFVIPPAGASGSPQSVEINIRLFTVRVESEDGEVLVEVERAVPVDRF